MHRAWAFIVGMANRISTSQMGLIAAGVAFYSMFAVFPAMTATIALWSFVADPRRSRPMCRSRKKSFRPRPGQFCPIRLRRLWRGQKPLWAGLASCRWSSRSIRRGAGVAALVQGLNVIHGTAQHPTIWGFIVGYALTLALIAAILIALATVVVVPLALAFLPSGLLRGWLLSETPWAATFVLVLSALAMLYRYGPTPEGRRGRWVFPGAMLAALAWSGASLAFSYYLTSFGTYNRIYGSLGAVIALMMWFYISAYAVLLGAALNAELSRKPQ